MGGATVPSVARGTTGDGVPGPPVDRSLWPELAGVAIDVLNKSKVQYGDIRLIESRTQSVRASDRRIASVGESTSCLTAA